MFVSTRRHKTSFVNDEGKASVDPFYLAFLPMLEFTNPDEGFILHFFFGDVFAAIGTCLRHIPSVSFSSHLKEGMNSERDLQEISPFYFPLSPF
jgi:hypothetical protein